MPVQNSDPVKLVLREAKHLHRAATSDSLAQALPVLRRLLSSNTFHAISLPDLHRRKNLVQRKHLLRMLAIEAGHASWEDYRKVLPAMTPDRVEHFDILRRSAGYPNLWFSSLEEAQAHVETNGGRALRVGDQAVVLVE